MTSASSKIIPKDPVGAALEMARKFSEALEKAKCNRKAEGVARRLKEFPQLMLQSGLVPALTFFLSKLDEDSKKRAYSETVKALLTSGGNVDKSICNDISGEGGGYPQTLALILAYTATIANCQPSDILSVDKRLVDCIRKIEGTGIVLERLVESYATELKKLASALYT